MAIPRQLTQIAFAAALDESTEDEILDPSIGFPVLQNVRQDRRGGLSKRLGATAVSLTRIDGTVRTEGRRCFSHKGMPCVINGRRIDAYSSQLQRNVDCGEVPDVAVTVRPLAASVDANTTATQHDQVVCNGFLVFVYTNATSDLAAGANVLVTTATDGLVISHDKQLFGLSDPIFQVGAFGTTVLLVSGAVTSNSFTVWMLDCTSATTVAAGWTSIYSNNVGKDTTSAILSLQSLSDRVVVAFINGSGGTSRVSVMAFDATGLIQNRAIFTNSITPENVAVEGATGGTIWVVWNESTDVKAIGLNPTALGTTTATVATILTGGIQTSNPPSIVSTGAAAATVIISGGDGFVRRRSWTVSAGAVSPGLLSELRGADTNSRGFLKGDRLLGLFYVDAVGGGGSGSLILADWSMTNTPTLPPLAMAYPNLANADPSAHVITLPDGRMAYVVSVLSAAQVRSYALVIYDFEERTRWQSAFHNGVTFLSGGLLSYFDGERAQECSFLHGPRGLDVTPDGGGTGPTGEVRYVVVFESVDAAGNLTQSGASDPLVYTGTGVQVFPTCDPILLTRRAVVRASLYRTITSGTVYYLVESRNALRDDVITFVDNRDDTSLESRPRLFGTGTLPGTYGGSLQREAAPYCQDIISYNGMLVIASGTDVWWSGQTIGGEGTWFSTEQFFETVEGEGDVVALEVLDGAIYALKQRSVFQLSGDAPADNGSSGGLGTPRRLSGDVGCIEPTSVLATSLGIFFQSARGIELLGGGGRPMWVGEKIQRTLASYPIVTSAVLDTRNNVVRFSLAQTVTSGLVVAYSPGDPDNAESPTYPSGGGRDVVFDLVLNDWQSIDNKRADFHIASQDACVADLDGAQRYAYLGADGALHVESDAWVDDGSWITMIAETGWFKIAGIQGRQQFNRLLALMRRRTDASINISIGYNYDETYATARTWTQTQIDDLLTAGWPITQLRHDPTDDAEGQSVRIRVEDSPPITDGGYDTGHGATWLALTLDITAKDGPAEVPEEAA